MMSSLGKLPPHTSISSLPIPTFNNHKPMIIQINITSKMMTHLILDVICLQLLEINDAEQPKQSNNLGGSYNNIGGYTG